MAINHEKVHGLATHTKELTIPIQDDGVAKPIAQLDFHYCRSKCGRVRDRDWFHHSKSAHPTACDQISFISFKTGVFAGRVTINVKHFERGLDWEAVNELTRFLPGFL